MSKFFAYLHRMKYIRRWGLMRSVEQENILEHTAEVAMLAHGLAQIKNTYFNGNADARLAAMYALFHECGEVVTGDLPTPIKYHNPRLKNAYKELEAEATGKIAGMLPEAMRPGYLPLMEPDRTSEEYAIMKAADKLSAYLKCVEELKAGNAEFKRAAESLAGELAACGRAEVDYFLRHFAPAYSLTLDELEGTP